MQLHLHQALLERVASSFIIKERAFGSSFNQGKLRCFLFGTVINGIVNLIPTVSILPPGGSQPASLLRCVNPPAFSCQDILSSEHQCAWC